MENKNLEEKWWYRLIKVVYIIIFVAVFWIPSTVIVVVNKPVLYESDSSYEVKCSNGRILKKTYMGSDLDWTHRDFIFDVMKTGTRNVCSFDPSVNLSDEYAKYGVKPGDEVTVEQMEQTFRNIPPFRNYSLILKEGVYSGSWTFAVSMAFLALLGTLLIFDLLRAVFLYVAVKKPFWKTLIFRD